MLASKASLLSHEILKEDKKMIGVNNNYTRAKTVLQQSAVFTIIS